MVAHLIFRNTVVFDVLLKNVIDIYTVRSTWNTPLLCQPQSLPHRWRARKSHFWTPNSPLPGSILQTVPWSRLHPLYKSDVPTVPVTLRTFSPAAIMSVKDKQTKILPLFKNLTSLAPEPLPEAERDTRLKGVGFLPRGKLFSCFHEDHLGEAQALYETLYGKWGQSGLN